MKVLVMGQGNMYRNSIQSTYTYIYCLFCQYTTTIIMVAISDIFYVHFYFIDSPDAPDILNTTPNEHQLLDLLIDIDYQWHEIGLALHVPHNDLEDLRASSYSKIIKLSIVVHSWIITQSIPVTWNTIIDAIEESFLKNKAVANKICCHASRPP